MAPAPSQSDSVGRHRARRRRSHQHHSHRHHLVSRQLRKIGFFALLAAASIAAGYMVSRCEPSAESAEY